MGQVRDWLKEAGVTPSKAMGQNFLSDGAVAARIVAAAALPARSRVVEIGPGLGALTRPLLAAGHQVTAIEKDGDVAKWLADQPWAGGLEILRADALEVDYAALAKETGSPLLVIANLPYSVGTAILLALLAQRTSISAMTLMFQKEVADRIAAPPGGKEYGSLSVLCQLYCRVESLFLVGPGAFVPAPKVHSSVVRLVVRPEPLAHVGDEERFSRLVRAAFGQRRKTLSNALKGVGIPGESLCQMAGIDGRRRGETLTVEEFSLLSRAWTSAENEQESR